MSEKDKKYMDPELEKFFAENKEMIERLFKEEKKFVKDAFEEEKSRMEELVGEKKNKAKETAQGVFGAFTDPDVQRHFMTMGIEFMMAMDALMKAMPFPDSVRDMAGKAEEARKSASENFSKASADRAKKPKPAEPEKIEIESAPKKRPASSARSKPSSGDKPKASD